MLQRITQNIIPMRNAGLSNMGITFCNYYQKKVLTICSDYSESKLPRSDILLHLSLSPQKKSLPRSQKLAREAGPLPSNTLEDVAPTELLVEIHTKKMIV